VEPESTSKTRWFWISLCTAIALILVIAIKQTADRRNAVRERKAEQPPLIAEPKDEAK
jgi:hypothetical protein